uniref:Phage portal protein, lambda family n=1 Tax=uncultured marine virus TaxID=186617 RepID=A0A0F7L464_9VIRU|nr:phage portal protein, lambda family [uncultured marine virus]
MRFAVSCRVGSGQRDMHPVALFQRLDLRRRLFPLPLAFALARDLVLRRFFRVRVLERPRQVRLHERHAGRLHARNLTGSGPHDAVKVPTQRARHVAQRVHSGVHRGKVRLHFFDRVDPLPGRGNVLRAVHVGALGEKALFDKLAYLPFPYRAHEPLDELLLQALKRPVSLEQRGPCTAVRGLREVQKCEFDGDSQT